MSSATIHLLPRPPRRGASAIGAAEARALWTRRFSLRLLELQPDLSVRRAAHYARAMFADAADLDPEEAALIFSAEEPPAGHRAVARLALVASTR
ncbi:MAG TPA: hypothetical protein VNU71_10735 [Burkholderiaceae bacterium]|nr:hypothetical protein [Burkholderiaceae bacterium]